ncbi:MAG: helix-turn-helix transcriptional regulator [Agathobacter sp.]|nr:helix-turn-helix transcriptional regulator [Agathobacter sp.]
MDMMEKLSFFQGLISCTYKVHIWSYNNKMELISSTSTSVGSSDISTGDALVTLNFSKKILSHGEKPGAYPLILDTDFGLIWVAAFEHQNDKLHRVHVLGPVFSGKNTLQLIKEKLDRANLSVKLRSVIFKHIENVPIIPPTVLLQYATMLHYAVTGQQISSDLVELSNNGDRQPVVKASVEHNHDHRGIWVTEQQFLKMIREGNPNYKAVLEKAMSLSTGVQVDSKNSLQQFKYNALILLTLCSRASIEGGVNPSLAYNMNDDYAKAIEQCKNVSELTLLNRNMMEDFVQQVRNSKENAHVSSQMQTTINYIDMHIREPLSIAILAKQLGYTEYYFSHKFKQETGKSLKQYILEKKIEEAKLLLSGTQMGIQEISDELNFGSRSYFYTCFQKQTGISPKEYREQFDKR